MQLNDNCAVKCTFQEKRGEEAYNIYGGDGKLYVKGPELSQSNNSEENNEETKLKKHWER